MAKKYETFKKMLPKGVTKSKEIGLEMIPEEELISPFILSVDPVKRKRLMKHHRKRSKRAQKIDESKNANITLNEKKWRKQPNRYDYPHIDTIPENIQMRRAQKALALAKKHKKVKKVKKKKIGAKGQFEHFERSIILSKNTGYVLAHEVGHAFDATSDKKMIEELKQYHSGKKITISTYQYDMKAFPKSDESIWKDRKQFQKISNFMRGKPVEIEGISDEVIENRKYRGSNPELFADAVASTIIQPSYTKKHFPVVFEQVKKQLKEYGL